ncbi:DnaJ-like protein DjlA [hydrothermal vent metagenome]|uniref:DnaJ-like protein DjlA n=1 Tax=hydrothermal vent metagenome TaxID=652676 RepID=A0A1W1D1Z9_9ZZZZ
MMMKVRTWIYLGILLFVLYYVFIANILVTLTVVAVLYIALKVYRVYARQKLHKTSTSKALFQKSELGVFIALVAKVAKADGRIDELEASLIGLMFDDISRIFPNEEKTREILKAIFNEEKERLDDTKEKAEKLNELLGRSKLRRKQYIEFLIQLAFVDGGVSSDEDALLRIIVEALNISSDDYDAMKMRFESMANNTVDTMSLDDAYKILGVDKNDDFNSIKKTYRKQVRQYHPDLIKSQNKDEAYIEEATVKMQELNQAYSIIKDAQ